MHLIYWIKDMIRHNYMVLSLVNILKQRLIAIFFKKYVTFVVVERFSIGVFFMTKILL